ncbi:MAG: APC family permease [Candidatus Cloacimonetes bacterium]|nr:APC family permease [Candidatus Cloacimonadota bacterium]
MITDKNKLNNSEINSDKKTKTKGIGVLGATTIGIGGMVGGGIFAVLGTAVGLARGGTPVAFIFAGIIALLTAYSYAKLSARYPSAGGTVVFIDRAFGIDLWTGSLNLILWLSYIVTIALYAAAFGAYGCTFFTAESSLWLKHVVISVGIILPAVINLLNADLVSKTETYVVLTKLVLLVIVIVAGAPHVDLSKFKFSEWPDPLTLIAGGMVIFVAYEGFELIANAGEDVKNPAKTLPRAYYLSVGFVIILYILVAIVTVGSLQPEMISQVKDYALAEAARPALGHIGFVIVAIAALMATFSAINATIYGNARLGYHLAKDGELPDILERKTWNRPVSGVLITSILALLLSNLVSLTAIAIMGSAGFLIIFATVNAACIKLAKPVKAKRLICILGFTACIAAIITLFIHTYEDNPHALWVVVFMILFSFIFEILYPKLTGRKIKLGFH